MEIPVQHPTRPDAPGSATRCPLCGAESATERERIRVADLDGEYQRQLKVSIVAEFPPGLSEIRWLQCSACGLGYFNPGIAGSARFYADLGRSQQYYSTTRWEFTETLKRLPPEPDLVDIGCGDGFFLSLVGGARKRGLELNPDAVRRAREKGLDVREGLLPTLADASTDVLTLFQVLEHVEKPAEVLRDAARVLRPGGRLFVAVPNDEAYIGRALHDPLNAPPHHPLRWRASALRHVPRVSPFTLEEILVEPLAPEHLHPYRRTRFIQAVEGLLGRRFPIYSTRPGMIWLRRIANVWTALSLKVAPRGPTTPGTGFSVMAVFRKVS
jgi:SAM-dependent methyltransferase